MFTGINHKKVKFVKNKVYFLSVHYLYHESFFNQYRTGYLLRYISEFESVSFSSHLRWDPSSSRWPRTWYVNQVSSKSSASIILRLRMCHSSWLESVSLSKTLWQQHVTPRELLEKM